MSQNTIDALPTISVITCTLNSEQYVERAIGSVLGQEYPGLNYWIIDGGSTDGTIRIIQKYEKYLQWVSEPDYGISDAMNKGIRASTGEVVAHLHSDDTYEKGTLLEVGRMVSEEPGVQWIIGDYHEIDRAGAIIKKVCLPTYCLDLLKKWNMIGHPSVFIRRRVFDEVGMFELGLSYAMDYDLWLRIGARYQPRQIHRALANFRVHESSPSNRFMFRSLAEEYAVRCHRVERHGLDRLRDAIRYYWRYIRYYWRFIRYRVRDMVAS